MKLNLPVLTTAQYETIIYVTIAVGFAMFAYLGLVELQNWLSNRKYRKMVQAQRQQAAVDYQLSLEHQVQSLGSRIEDLQGELRIAFARELDYLNERKITNQRLNFLSKELTCDDMNKHTTVFRR